MARRATKILVFKKWQHIAHFSNLNQPECFLPADTARVGEGVGHIENQDQPASKAGAGQTPRHTGQDGTFATEGLTTDCMADKKVSVEDDPHG